MRLENKVALISGGARGIGAAVTKIFAREGAKLVIGDILEVGRRTAEEVSAAGGECYFVKLDVTSEADWAQAVSEVTTRFGRLDILVNNAGVSARGNIEETSEAVWSRTMDINVKGAFLGTKQAIPMMRAGGGGSIVNISSGAGIAPQPNTSGAYAASKGAVRIFTKSTAIQYAKENIRCNSVHPGPIETDMLLGERTEADELELMQGRVPLGRFGKAEEIANGVLYLATDESSFVTGSELVIDGGRTAQ